MPLSRSEFLKLTSLGTVGYLTRNALALPSDYTGPPTGIRPYLQSPRPDSIWVSWLTSNESSGTIEWGTSPTDLNQSIPVTTDSSLPTGFRYHIGQITGLSPRTFYYYRVVNGSGVTSEVFRFRTPPPDGSKNGTLRVLVLGDNQILGNSGETDEQRFAKFVACAKSKIEQTYSVPIEEAIDLIIMPGDQVDNGSMAQYRDIHFAMNSLISPNVPIMTSIGNHETYSDSGLTNYKKMFRYSQLSYANVTSPDPQVYYAYQIANVAFIHTSSEHGNDTQKTWLRSITNALKSDSSTDLCVSLVHRPYQAEQYIGDISSWFRSQIMPMLAETEKHVLNIGAHHHLYARGQTRDWPIYHIISGGTAWDQYWGQSNESDYDDVQKTIANWAWQLLEFDLAAKSMDVKCYAEANVKFPKNERWTTRAYHSRLIDAFHRKLGLPAPNKPNLTNVFAGSITPPFELSSSNYSTTSSEPLNSTQFQIAADPNFTTLRFDKIRDIENVYGTTGAPDYEPVNINQNVNILNFTVTNSLANGIYYARVRHRDTNATWSPWSDVKSFQVTSDVTSAPISIKLAKSVYSLNEDISVTFENGPGNAKDWVGIYKKGQTAGSATPSTSWYYVNGTTTAGAANIKNGTILFTKDLAIGEWYAAFFSNDSYTEIAPRVAFYVGDTVTLTPTKENYAEGETVTINYASAPSGTKDWIGIYKIDQTPGAGTPSVAYKYATSPSGSVDFTSLTKGYYYATFMINDGYQEISARVRFSIGNRIATVTMDRTIISAGQAFNVSFKDGPGIPKDWIGLYKDGDEPGVQDLLEYRYFNGTTSGSVNYNLPKLAPGRYWVAMFTNDSYTEVSNRLYFDVIAFEFEQTRLENGQMQLRWKTIPGRTYIVQKNTSLAPASWIDVQTIIATSTSTEFSLPVDLSSQRGFYRIKLP